MGACVQWFIDECELESTDISFAHLNWTVMMHVYTRLGR
jgi:hypothetical protein